MEGMYGLYRGICANNNDPEGLLRITAIVPTVFGSADTVTSWAWPCFPPGLAISAPLPGSGVWVSFEGGDTDYPAWVGVWDNGNTTPVTDFSTIDVEGGATVGGNLLVGGNTQVDGGLNVVGVSAVTTISASGSISASELISTTKTGATDQIIYGPGTATGPPSTGTWIAGTIVPDLVGGLWECVTSGTPGTWISMGITGNPSGRIYPTAGTPTSSGAVTPILHMTADFMYGGMVQAGNTLVVPETGPYLVSWYLGWDATAFTGYIRAILVSGGGGIRNAYEFTDSAYPGMGVGNTDRVYLIAGASLSIDGVASTTSNTVGGTSASWLSAALDSR